LEGAETIFWNGPMGVFEKPAFAKGTFELARHVAQSKAKKLAGGGDVAAAIAASGREEEFDFISTGGGATLEYLEGKPLPGLRILDQDNRLGI
jgi:phosphoglycerate kinase